MVFEYKGMKISFCESVYEPSDDTFLLLGALEKENWTGAETVLEVGCGTGIVSVFLSKKAKEVFSLDINRRAVSCARRNAEANDAANMHVFSGDLFSGIGRKKFDVLVFNTPYLPEDKVTGKFGDSSWSGGKSGRKVIDRFLRGALKHIAPRGKIFLVESSLSDCGKTLDYFKENGIDAKIISEKKLFFEKLVVIKAAVPLAVQKRII